MLVGTIHNVDYPLKIWCRLSQSQTASIEVAISWWYHITKQTLRGSLCKNLTPVYAVLQGWLYKPVQTSLVTEAAPLEVPCCRIVAFFSKDVKASKTICYSP